MHHTGCSNGSSERVLEGDKGCGQRLVLGFALCSHTSFVC